MFVSSFDIKNLKNIILFLLSKLKTHLFSLKMSMFFLFFFNGTIILPRDTTSHWAGSQLKTVIDY